MKIEKLSDNSIKISGPEASKVGGNLTPEQLIVDLQKYVAKSQKGGVEPNCAVCISD